MSSTLPPEPLTATVIQCGDCGTYRHSVDACPCDPDAHPRLPGLVLALLVPALLALVVTAGLMLLVRVVVGGCG